VTTTATAAAVAAAACDRLFRRIAEPAPMVCGIVNVTPDSFFDGGRFDSTARAVEHGCALEAEGAEILDVGGESTRPGARPPALAEELARVIPVVEALAAHTSVPISVDTSRAEVMREAVAAGAVMINDVRALRLRGALEAAAALAVPVCLMHMQGIPPTMQESPAYHDVTAEVSGFLVTRAAACQASGVPRETAAPSARCQTGAGSTDAGPTVAESSRRDAGAGRPREQPRLQPRAQAQ